MPGFGVGLILIVAATAGAMAEGTAVCRPNALGAVACPAAATRPQPRPVHRSDARGLDRVFDGEDRPEPRDGFVPARDVGRLGGATLTRKPMPGLCRSDSLGNLRCR